MAEPRKASRFWQTVRGRLLIIALLPMLVLTPVLLGITMQRWLMRTDQILNARVTSDLTVGRQYLGQLMQNTARDIAAIAASASFQSASPGQMPALLEAERQRLGLDFLLLTEGLGPQGAALPRENGLVVLDAPQLALISPALASRARLDLVATEGSPAPATSTETRGLVVLASAPGGQDRLLGGILLNRNEDFIDRISALIYPGSNPGMAGQGISPDLDKGVITLFLGNTRISTTLRPDGGARAIGTGVSAAVSAQVLGEGRSWHDTAFVVNGWYISAYEALTDIHGARVGMLYAGIPKAPYTQARQVTFLMIGAAFLLVGGLFVPLALAWARSIFRPVEAMGDTIRRVEAGDMAARSGALPGATEITRVATHLDQLLTGLESRDRSLRGMNDELNARVEARTADLTRANQALEATSRQLILAEKMATIGEVTAGVAHEINNPLAVISGNLEVVRMVLAEREPEAETELALIDEQIRRINGLVTQLLQFARPEEFTDEAGTDPAGAIAGLRPLVRHLLTQGQVRLEERLASTRRIRMNPHELQQVLINLIANAVQAMAGGGEITLSLADDDSDPARPGLVLTLADNGPGMDETTLSRVFEPFFTTRGREGGTGLGLPICLSLITRQGGTLTASTSPGQGTSFRIWLPALPDDAAIERDQD